jgi:ABC-type Fe3+/spermidine/putrescine transport system ATPase subunit
MSAPEPAFHLSLEHVTHRYGGVTALDDVSFALQKGEFVTLLGPSGCGKTTLLRIIGGFIRPTHGRVVLDGNDVTRVPPHKRPVNMVFQRSTLFPHLDVAGNIAFGLRIAKLPRREIDDRVQSSLSLVHLEGFDRRMAHELSGGQLQRVALARALVNQPKVLLLDEPLSALDLRIRVEMEAELRRVHRETGATFVYVTHDQREALALSDRIAVFDHGHVEQVGTPEDVYRRPDSAFAARFVGDANVIPCDVLEVSGDAARVRFGSTEIVVGGGEDASTGPAWLMLRPEVVGVSTPDGLSIRGVVSDVSFRGTGYSYRVDVPGVESPFKAEVGADKASFPIGSEVGLDWSDQACRLIPRRAG